MIERGWDIYANAEVSPVTSKQTIDSLPVLKKPLVIWLLLPTHEDRLLLTSEVVTSSESRFGQRVLDARKQAIVVPVAHSRPSNDVLVQRQLSLLSSLHESEPPINRSISIFSPVTAVVDRIPVLAHDFLLVVGRCLKLNLAPETSIEV